MKKITVALEFNEETNDVLDHSAKLATALGAKIDVVHVFEPNPMILQTPYLYDGAISASLEFHQESLKAQEEKIREIVDGLQRKNVKAHGHMHPAERDFAGTILNFAKDQGSDLIVVGSHRPGRLERIILGSVSGELVRRSTIPVLVIPRPKLENE